MSDTVITTEGLSRKLLGLAIMQKARQGHWQAKLDLFVMAISKGRSMLDPMEEEQYPSLC